MREITREVMREITIAPGGSTGWHWHRGRLYGVIEAGTLTHHAATHDTARCTLDGRYSGGDPITEADPDHVHIGRNLGAALAYSVVACRASELGAPKG
jgi:rhamnogalacturonyl hydrolase YesR